MVHHVDMNYGNSRGDVVGDRSLLRFQNISSEFAFRFPTSAPQKVHLVDQSAFCKLECFDSFCISFPKLCVNIVKTNDA